MAQGVGVRSLEGDAQGSEPAAGPRRCDRAAADDGAGEAAAGSEGGSAGGGGCDRLVRRGGAPDLRPRYSCPRRGRLPARGEGTGRAGGRFHAVEFPDQPGGTQAVMRARRRVLHHREGAGGDACLAGGIDPLLCRCRRAGGCDEPGLWCAIGNLRIPHSAPDHSQDVVHRFHRGGQAACRDRRCAHEARHHGTGRPRAGDRVRRR